MSGFSIRNPYLVIVVSLIAAVIGLTSLVRMPVDLFPDINIPEVVVATFYTGMPPEQIETDITGRFERFFTLGAGHRSHGVAVAPWREHHQGVLPARDERGFGRERDLEPRDGRPAPPATRHAAANRAKVRRFEPSGLSDHVAGRGAERNATARPRSVHRAEPAGRRLRRVGAAALRRQVPPDHGLRRSGEAAGVPDEPDGRRPRGQQCQPDPAVRRRQDRAVRLHHLHQQPVPHDSRHQRDPAQDRRPVDGDRGRRGPRRGRPPDPEQHRDRGRPAIGLPPGDEAGRRHQHDCRRRRREGSGRPAGGRSQRADAEGGVRSVAVREAGDRDAARRRRHRAGPDRADGAGVPRQLPRDRGGVPVDSAVGAGGDHCALHGRQLDQHDDPRRVRAGILPPH